MGKLDFWQKVGLLLCAAWVVAAFAWIGHAFDFSKGDWAAWVQAIGSVAAILVAIWVMNTQLRAASAHQEKEQIAAVKNLLKAIYSEITIFENSVRNIFKKLEVANRFNNDGMFKHVFPDIGIHFPVFEAAASGIGRINNDELRTEIIVTYAFIRSWHAYLAQNSNYAAQVPHDQEPTGTLKVALEQMGPRLMHDAELLLDRIKNVKAKISAEVE